MNNKVENIVLSVVAVLAVAVVVVLYICGARRQSGMECGGVRVNVTDSKVNKFVSEGDVKKIVSTNYGDITGVFADPRRISQHRHYAAHSGRKIPERGERMVCRCRRIYIPSSA